MRLYIILLFFVVVPLLAIIVALVLLATGRAGVKLSGRATASILGLSLVLFIIGGLILTITDNYVERTRRASCLSNVLQISLSMIQYAQDYNGQYPSALLDDSEPAQRRFARLLKSGYLNAPKVFHCYSTSYYPYPDETKLDGPTLNESSLQSIADIYLTDHWSSYGADIRVTYKDPASRVRVADRPDHRYWGTGVNSPPAGHPGSNSENHRGRSQTIGYNDGHIVRSHTCADDSGIDPNIYASNPDLKPAYDSNIDFGAAPPP